MNGKQLYEFYVALHARRNCMVDPWCDMEPHDQNIWEEMADLLCPELSDDAKEMMK